MIAFAQMHWAELLAVGGSLLTMLAATALVDLFNPSRFDVQVRRTIFLIDAPIGFVVSYTLWSTLDQTPDPALLRIFLCVLVCLLGALGAPYSSRLALAVIKWKWPGLDVSTVFAKKSE